MVKIDLSATIDGKLLTTLVNGSDVEKLTYTKAKRMNRIDLAGKTNSFAFKIELLDFWTNMDGKASCAMTV